MKKWHKHCFKMVGFVLLFPLVYFLVSLALTYIPLVGYVLLIPLVYFLVSLMLTYIPYSVKTDGVVKTQTIYLRSNGVHADIVLPKEAMTEKLLDDVHLQTSDRFFSFGWGDENFYLNTPTLADLKFSTVVRAFFFLNSNVLVHITRYDDSEDDWTAVPVTEKQLLKLNNYILKSFALDRGRKNRLDVAGYTLDRDEFYSAAGHYMFYKTCNSWVNTALKESGIKASLWTPYEFGVLRWHQS